MKVLKEDTNIRTNVSDYVDDVEHKFVEFMDALTSLEYVLKENGNEDLARDARIITYDLEDSGILQSISWLEEDINKWLNPEEDEY